VGSFELALGVGANLFCGTTFGAVCIEADIGVEVDHGGLIIFLAEMEKGEKAVNFGLLRFQGLRGFRRFQRGFETHAVELQFSQFVVTNPGVWIQFESTAE
jgi:hypothetical protein